jgi:acetylornithine deacetylase/succinyl-diaminopimelate desuccinylase-like protein
MALVPPIWIDCERAGIPPARAHTGRPMTSRACRMVAAAVAASAMATASLTAQPRPVGRPDWPAVERDTLEHFQAILRLDTSNPPGNETAVVNYLSSVLTREGIAFETFALEPGRANLVARVKGNGSRRPLLIMGHTDVVTTDPAKWTFPPFSATRDGGYIYGRGSLDDKPHVVAGLMTLVLLKRLNVPLDRDVIFLAEAGEEGTTRVGIDFMTTQHFDAIDAEFCLAEGGGVRREGGRVTYASVGTMEKVPRTIELIARGPSSHGSVPTRGNAVARLAKAVATLTEWQPPIRLNETTREYFTRLAALASRDDAARFRALLGDDPAAAADAVRYFEEHSPNYAALLRPTISPTVLKAGSRYNVIPSEATATLDVRLLPDQDPAEIVSDLQKAIDDPAVEVRLAARDGLPRPPGMSGIATEAFRAIESAVAQNYDTVTIPAMGTGATDNAQMRARGVQCYGMGPATDAEDAPKGFGAHSDQERILESELQRFVRFTWDVVINIARARR